MMDLETNKLAHIRYTKTTDFGGGRRGEVTERVVIPTFVPDLSIKALDVSELSEKEAFRLRDLMEEYSRYVELKMKTIFSFEDWLTCSGCHLPSELKYRTFKVDSLEVIKSE